MAKSHIENKFVIGGKLPLISLI
ncbi:hypothetical protein Godav_026054 [Gossypium davidsonii]|uniref:Uncharacterized protein n=2 Tax=Gossypium TaxID=3633 RepID=A0A7J8THZ4_GOSDV|nr:hypothetical protein [Gossypium davidsonii]MBA0637830.1 hypothetical protein [Gossypium davidsonii]